MTVTVCAKQEDTTALLAKVLDGDGTAASLLAEAIHQKLQLQDELAEKLQLPLNPEDLAIWIDPIGNETFSIYCNFSVLKVNIAIRYSGPRKHRPPSKIVTHVNFHIVKSCFHPCVSNACASIQMEQVSIFKGRSGR